MNRIIPHPRPQAGFSLLELFIAMTLGLLLLGGLLTVYSASSLSYRVAENTNRMQEGARHAFSILGEHIRSAGYMGCFASPDGPSQNLALPLIPFNAPAHLVGHEAIAAGNHVNTLDGRAAVANDYAYAAATHGTAAADQGLAGTDALTVRRASVRSMLLNADMANKTAAIPIQANSLGLSVGDYVLVGDCASVDMLCAQANTFTKAINASAASAGCTGNTTNPPELNKIYEVFGSARVRPFEEATFFIRMNPANQPALYWRSRVGGTPRTEELVEGVQDMQLCFGEDTDTPIDRIVNVYRPANTVANWANVVSVRVTLLMRSLEDGIATAPQAYGIDRNCDGVIDAAETFTPADRRVRRAFTTTFSVRNRLP
jgi:type IV pilus assembly protein PilW